MLQIGAWIFLLGSLVEASGHFEVISAYSICDIIWLLVNEDEYFKNHLSKAGG